MNVKKRIAENKMKQYSKIIRINGCNIFPDISINYCKNIENTIKFVGTKTDREDHVSSITSTYMDFF